MTAAISPSNETRLIDRLNRLLWPFPTWLGTSARTDAVKLMAAALMVSGHLSAVGVFEGCYFCWIFGRSVYPLFAVAFALHMGSTVAKARRTALTLTIAAVATQPLFLIAFSHSAIPPLETNWYNGNALFAFAGGAWFQYFLLKGRWVEATVAALIFAIASLGLSGGFNTQILMVGAILASGKNPPLFRIGGALMFWIALCVFQPAPIAGIFAILSGGLALILTAAILKPKPQWRLVSKYFFLVFYPAHLLLLASVWR